MKIDLHIHTICSDGTDDWKTVLQKAEEAGVQCLSLTDHNNVDVYFQMKNPEKYFSGKIIKGVEPECAYHGRCIELLGYDIDIEKMNKALDGLYLSYDEMYTSKGEIFYKGCVEAGIKFSRPNMMKYWDRNKHYYPTGYLHEDLKKFPENKKLFDEESWNNSIQWYRNFSCKKGTPFYIDEANFYPSAKTIYEAIRAAGGKVFIPHIFLYGDDSLPFLEGLMREFKIDGIECFYNCFTEEQTQFLLDYCKKHNLLVSAGSDYHGSSRPHIKLGVSDPRLKDVIKWVQ